MVLTIQPDTLDIKAAQAAKAKKGYSFSLLIPARGHEAAETLGEIISINRKLWMRKRGLIDEIGVVVDLDSDGNDHDMIRIALEAGADWAVMGADVLQQHAPGDTAKGAGKAGAMRSLAFLASGTHLLFHDADLVDYNPRTTALLIAAACKHDVAVVNGSSPRRTGDNREGGRTTEMLRSLIAKQLSQHVPGVTDIVQLLIGEFIVKADVFANLSFSRGYGIETSLKVLALDFVGPAQFAQVELPTKRQVGQHYLDLVKQFHEISYTVDVLERHFYLRKNGVLVEPAEIAAKYDRHFPGRGTALMRPEGYDENAFEPRTSFYTPLCLVPGYQDDRRFDLISDGLREEGVAG